MAKKTTLVQDLQQLAMTGNVSVTEILRMALVVASKLNIQDFQDWIENELNGYKGDEVLPSYRLISGSPMAFNPQRGWIPCQVANNEIMATFSEAKIRESISEVESMGSRSKGIFYVEYSAEHQRFLNEYFEMQMSMTFAIHLQISQLIGILNKVRDVILKWSLKLEEQGILGDGMSFSDDEKKAATNNPNIHIGAVYGQVRMNTDSTDNSINTVNVDASSVFNNLRNSVRQIADTQVQAVALEKIDAIEKAKDKKTATEKFGELMAIGASIATVGGAVIPYAPALMEWIGKLV